MLLVHVHLGAETGGEELILEQGMEVVLFGQNGNLVFGRRGYINPGDTLVTYFFDHIIRQYNALISL